VRVGLDARPALYTASGIGTYVRELVPALARAFPGDRFEGYAHRLRRRRARLDRPAWPANARLHDRPIPATAVRVLAHVGLGAERLLGGVDLLHLTDYVDLPARRAPLVATLHDVLFATLPDSYTPIMRANLDAFTRRTLARARHVIVPSARVKTDLVERFDADAVRVHVVPHGTPAACGAAPCTQVAPRAPYVLALGTLEPRKNLPRLLAALDLVRARGLDVGAVVAGGRGWLDEPIVAAVAARPWVTPVGPVGRAEVARLLSGAAALAYPSLGEGFGLPVLEGFAAGVPVLVGAGTACADLAGDAALAADPRDVEALAHALERLLSDTALRRDLVRRGREVAAAHTWELAARATYAVYERALSA
jgi:glycosyltransferase involved in cell wall biosynthesis